MNGRQSRQPRGALFGGFVGLPSLLSVEAFAHAGFDFVVLDLQHGTFSMEFALSAVQLLDVLGVESLLRVGIETFPLVPRILDFGVSGVILASVEDPATVESALTAVRYQPEGTRSYGQQRKGLKPEPADPRSVRPKVYAMIETNAGLDRVESIAAVADLSGLVIGPSDLALALGLGPDEGPSDARWRAAIETIRLAAAKHGISACMVTGDGETAAAWAHAGFDRVVIGSDVGHLLTRVQGEVARARALYE